MSFSIRRLKAALGESPSDTWQTRAQRRAQRIAELEQLIVQLKGTQREYEQRLTESQRRLDARRQTSPRPEILAQVLRVRAGHLPASPAQRAEAEARDLHLRQASPAYAETVEG